MKVLIGTILGLLLAAPSLNASAQSYGAAPDGSTFHGQLLAQKKKKKKKKKSDVQLEDEAFGPDGVEAVGDGDSGTGVHREQEGVDTPYKAEISLRTDLSFLSVEVGEADPYQNTIIDIGVEWLFVLGSLEVGPDISYKSFTTATTTKTTDTTTGQTKTEVSEVSNSSYSVGGMFKWNFGNIDRGDLIPFAYAGVAYRAAESKAKGGGDPVESSGTVIKAGGGVNLFLDSNVAFNPRAEFRMETDKDDSDENAVETTTSGLKILVGVAVFI
jgi:hypothetical protein